ncbi:MAG TPA: hypothetical protein VFY82_02585 [Acidimicrobiales bacterium]|nr:hypothetical protein [Acidimicrobiales bacterium]
MPDSAVPLRRTAAALVAAGALLLGACAQEASDSVATGRGAETTADADGAGGSEGDDRSRDDDSGDDSGEAPDLVAAMEATRASESAEVEMLLDVDSPMGGGTVDMTGDLSRGDHGTATFAAEMGATVFELEMVADGEALWITSDAEEFTDAMPEGATWVEGSVDDLRDDGVWTGLDTTFDVLSVLRGVDGVSETGTTEIGGDEVRLFEGDVDWDAALAASEEADPAERRALEETITLTGDPDLETFTVEVGLDDDDRVRSLDVEVVAGPPEPMEDEPFAGEITLRVRLEIVSLDHEVEFPDGPPADETVPLSEAPEVAELLVGGL